MLLRRRGMGHLRRPGMLLLFGGMALLQLLSLLLMLTLHVRHRLRILLLRSHLRVVLLLLLGEGLAFLVMPCLHRGTLLRLASLLF